MENLKFTEAEWKIILPQLRLMEQLEAFFNDREHAKVRVQKVEELLNIYQCASVSYINFLRGRKHEDVRHIVSAREFEKACHNVVMKATNLFYSRRSTPLLLIALHEEIKKLCTAVRTEGYQTQLFFQTYFSSIDVIWSELQEDFACHLEARSLTLINVCHVM